MGSGASIVRVTEQLVLSERFGEALEHLSEDATQLV